MESLNCAKGELDGQLIISFSDIIYDFKILKKIILSKNDKITLAIDKNWKKDIKIDTTILMNKLIKLN